MATTPTPLPTNVNAAIHGPYEDCIIAGFALLEKIIDSQDAATKVRLWEGFITFQTGLQAFADKVDVFHLFKSNS